MSENNDLILLIVTCFIILTIHTITDYHIHIRSNSNSDKQINNAILKDIVVVILYLLIKLIIINL
jgi:hypothetical protein